ncbi:LysR family transcriptional regulator [Photobacterium toruni]|uniref:Glycine cleavage system transcriptional activator n=1 Tax=Photobacterium toruni TaxID=1935446 RepID=A0A1T4QSQ7_9GAMM|nr:LysR family transcriptional regulator [Photobacterium toruni]MEC6815307.1 LysR family transcriptional regulator [Photobacterium toruni]MEC6830834.1 LysR family transcriptional regulator [Photobacterium toruni]SKA06760.1 Glycine cleavage system transcriptional activator [Photobacterium toruni]
MRPFPPLKGIIYFEASARLQSFKLAAEELFVTPGAVSHQIQTLEAFIGQKLFIRQHRGIKLTNAGIRYFNRIALILKDLDQATTDIGFVTKTQKMTVSIPPTLLNKWLLPRINYEYLSENDISVVFVDTIEMLDLNKENIDISIRYCIEKPNEKYCRLLFEEQMIAVCAPDYIDKPLIDLSQELLATSTLIETTNRLIQWDLILANNNIKPYPNQSKVYFQNSMHAIEAAIQGIGIAFINRFFVESYLEQGLLVEAIDMNVIPDKIPGYYLVSNYEKMQNPATQLLYQEIESYISDSIIAAAC